MDSKSLKYKAEFQPSKSTILLDILVLVDKTLETKQLQGNKQHNKKSHNFTKKITIMSGLIQAGVGAVTNSVNSIFDRRTARRNTDANIAANKWQSKHAYQQDLSMWHRQNRYNDPSMQMARFKKAGLNPNLMYGQGNAGNASSMPKYNPAKQEHNYKAAKLPEMANYQNLMLTQANIDSVKQNTELSESKETNEIIKSGILENVKAKSDEENIYLKNLYPYNLKAKQEGIRKQGVDITKRLQGIELGKKDFGIKDQLLEYQKGMTSKVKQEAYNKKLLNDWMEQGIVPQDNILFRMLQRTFKSPKKYLENKKNKNPFTW